MIGTNTIHMGHAYSIVINTMYGWEEDLSNLVGDPCVVMVIQII